MGSLPHVVEDCLGILQVYSDGSICRSNVKDFEIPFHQDDSVVFKDCVFDAENHLQLRLYKPSSSSTALLRRPIVYFLHGGGFCFGSRTWPNFHNSCLRLCSGLDALVIAPDYRLAPEHRLPAAMDDATTALKWLQGRASTFATTTRTVDHEDDDDDDDDDDEYSWLRDGDYERVFIVGDSSGGNMAHHLAVKLGPGSPELAPVKVRGYVLMAPFFGGTERTKSEAEGPPEPLLNLEILDKFWRLALPAEGDSNNSRSADHPLANPFGPWSRSLEEVQIEPILVVVGGGEIMRDRVHNYAKRLKELGKAVDYVEMKDQHHGFFTNQPYSPVATTLLLKIQAFISSISF